MKLLSIDLRTAKLLLEAVYVWERIGCSHKVAVAPSPVAEVGKGNRTPD